MNYIKFNIGGELRGFKFGLKFLSDILSRFDTDIMGLGELLDKNPFLTRPVVLYLAHKYNCERQGLPVNFTESDVIEWIDNLDNGISHPDIIECVRMVVESIRAHMPKTDEVQDSTEKKS